MSSRLSNINVLIVDDEKLMSKLVGDVLTSLGFRSITVARNGRQAIKAFSEQPFDMVITDWRMEETDGLGLLQFIRTSPSSRKPKVPVIFLTGNTEMHEVFAARDAGVTEYMIKPFSARQLVDRIRFIIEQPRSFVEAPAFKGPDRRRQDKPPADGIEKRMRAA